MANFGYQTPGMTPAGNRTADDGQTETVDLSEVNMLKFLVMLVNRDIAEVGLANPLTIQDLDCLDQNTFVKILIFLLTAHGLYTADQILGKRELLLRLKDGDLPVIEYNATTDHIYYATKALFPDGDETFSYAMLLKPQSNPKAVKAVLQYLMKFTVFAENLSEAFEQINVDVAAEFAQRNELHRQIDAITVKLAERASQLDMKRSGVIGLQQTLNVKNVELAKEEDVLVELEKELAKYKKIYDTQEQDKLRMERTLEEAQQHRARLESKIVSNPEVIQLQHKFETEKLAELIQEREEVGQQLDQVTAEDQWVDELVKKGETLLVRLEECCAKMVEVAGMYNEQKGVDNLLLNLEAELKAITTNLRHLNITKEKLIEENEGELRQISSKLAEMDEELDVLRSKVMTVNGRMVDNEAVKQDIVKRLGELNAEIAEKEQHIADNEMWLKREVTAELVDVAVRLKTLREDFKRKIEDVYSEYRKPRPM